MKSIIVFLFVIFMIFCITSLAFPTPTSWIRCFGGSKDDYGWAVQQTNDGGFIVVGTTKSFGSGSTDIWMIKTDNDGNMEWNRTFGGSGSEYGSHILQAIDNGYVIIGTDNDGFWMFKTDINGNMEWDKNLPGNGGNYIQKTSDGGYIITGYYTGDVWLLKTDSNGNKMWDKTYGGEKIDIGNYVEQTIEGGYIIVGRKDSYGSGDDIWLIKTDESGTKEWDKTYGGGLYQAGNSGQQTSDGGFILVGDNFLSQTEGRNVWMIKTDSNGKKIWDKNFGGSSGDMGYSVQQTNDNGYIITGRTQSFGSGLYDVWLIKTDSNGNMEWDSTFGGNGTDTGRYVQQTSDGGYIIAGNTESFGSGNSDIFLIKTDSSGYADMNNPPDKPTIFGPISGRVRKEYEYSIVSNDLDNDLITYIIDWGIGDIINYGPFISGEVIILKNSWNVEGNYNITAKAVDSNGAESDWGNLEVIMTKTKSYSIFNPWFSRLFEQFQFLELLKL